MPIVCFLPSGQSLELEAGITLLEAARRAGAHLEAPCAGVGTCSKCRVRIISGESPASPEGCRHELTRRERAQGWVLACRQQLAADLTLEIPEAAGGGLVIAGAGRQLDVPPAPAIDKRYDPIAHQTLVLDGETLLGGEAGDTTGACFGLAVDIGTTTLVAALVDLLSGRELAVASALNPQTRHGQDVLSRIRFAAAGGLATLQGDLAAELNRLIGCLTSQTGIAAERIYEAVLSGNTCMLHLALGVDPASLGQYPYTPMLRGGSRHCAAEIGLEISAMGVVYLPPVISAYVGADLSAGLLATALDGEARTVLLIDIGTNGEMILAHEGKLFATSTAAGPAFEGMNIRCGMRASAGAIERVRVNEAGEIELAVIGGGEPRGLCGSGLIDAVAELVRCGVVTKAGGLVRDPAALPPALAERLTSEDGKPIFVLGGTVVLTRGDLRQVQLAKGAIRAGIDLLLRQVGLTAEQLDEVLIAGSFGLHLRPESLLTLGLLPPEVGGRIRFVGNTSKTGSQALLRNRHCRDQLQRSAARVEVLELANLPDFEKVFVGSLGFFGP